MDGTSGARVQSFSGRPPAAVSRRRVPDGRNEPNPFAPQKSLAIDSFGGLALMGAPPCAAFSAYTSGALAVLTLVFLEAGAFRMIGGSR